MTFNRSSSICSKTPFQWTVLTKSADHDRFKIVNSERAKALRTARTTRSGRPQQVGMTAVTNVFLRMNHSSRLLFGSMFRGRRVFVFLVSHSDASHARP